MFHSAWVLGIFKCFTDFHCITVWMCAKVLCYGLLFCNNDWRGGSIHMHYRYLHCVHMFIWRFSSEYLFSNLEEVLGSWVLGHSKHVLHFTRNKQVNFQSSHFFLPHQQCVRVPIVQDSVSSYHCFSLSFYFSWFCR